MGDSADEKRPGDVGDKAICGTLCLCLVSVLEKLKFLVNVEMFKFL